MTFRVLFLVSTLAFAGCAVQTESPEEGPTASTEEAARRADPCAVVRCAAGTHCVAKGKTAECVADKTGVACGSTTCAPGDVCCNASCGICTPPGGMCIQLACEPATL
ncbi:MAG: hypothetical protein HYV09_30510 [Deltaproteobacteria bacterium]|nr:hypothetical protein [Deltaproteobacteria bacterium]